jgi:hypothetical protein
MLPPVTALEMASAVPVMEPVNVAVLVAVVAPGNPKVI